MDERILVDVECPYCGESIELLVDWSEGAQRTIEDCEVCCRPMHLDISIGASGEPSVVVRQEDD